MTTKTDNAVAPIILIVLFFELKWLCKKSGTVIELYLSVRVLNFSAIKCHDKKTPMTSPITIQNALTPIIAPIPVTPNNNQPDSPVDLAERAAIQ